MPKETKTLNRRVMERIRDKPTGVDLYEVLVALDNELAKVRGKAILLGGNKK